MDDEPIVPLSRLLISKLHISDCYEDGFDLLDKLSGQGLVFDEITADYQSQHGRIVDAFGANVKCLRLLPRSDVCMCIIRESIARLAKSETMFPQTTQDTLNLQHYSLIAESSGN